MALKFSMILQAVDKVTAPTRKISASVKSWTAQVRKASSAMREGGLAAEALRTRQERLNRVARGRGMQLLAASYQAAATKAKALGRAMADLPRRLRLVERAGKAAGNGLKWIGGKALGLAKWGAAAAGAAAGFTIFDMFRKASQFEQFQIMLEGTEGSAAKAKKAMGWVQQFATKTPYELDQVMEAFVQLKAYGIDPTNGSLLALGDASSGMSKPLLQSVEAMADAITGEFERLKEFGIRASKAGDKVTFTYRKNGQDIRRESRMTGSEIEKTLSGIFTDRFGGGMARQAGTMAGIISNLKDTWSNFLLMIANAGVFDTVKAKLQQWLDKLNTLAKDGRLQAWAKKISDWLETAFDWAVKFVEETDWAKVGREMQTIASAVVTLANAVVKVAEWGSKFKWALAVNPLSFGLPGALWRGEIGGSEDKPAKPSVGRAPSKADAVNATRKRNSRMYGSPLLSPGKAVPIGGKVAVDIDVKGPATARVRSVASANPNVPMEVRLGKTMAGAA